MLDLLQKSDRINIADEIHYVNQIKNKSGKYCREKPAFGVFHQHPLAFRLFLEGKMKRCPKCKEKKPLSAFHIDNSKKDKHKSYCKKCLIKVYIRTKKKYDGLTSVWSAMKQRCNNPNDKHFNRYGGRGITVCKEWQDSFQVFYEWAITNGHKKGLTIDRRNNDGNYCPENCRFVTQKENIHNSSRTKLTVEKVKEIKKLLKEGKMTQTKIANIFDVSCHTIWGIKERKIWVFREREYVSAY